MQPFTATLLSLCCLLFAEVASAKSKVSAALVVERRTGAEQCDAAGDLERAVESRLHRKVFTTQQAAELRIELVLAQDPDAAWSAELTLHSAAGEYLGQRKIVTSAPHCSALDESLALVIALFVDSPPPPVPEPVPAAGPAASSPESPSARVAPEPSGNAPRATEPPAQNPHSSGTTTLLIPADTHAPREPWHADTALTAAVAAGALPGIAFAPELSVGVQPAHLPELRLFGGEYLNRETRTSTTRGARFALAYLGLELCPLRRARGWLRPIACIGQSLGRLRAQAFGFDQNSGATLVAFAIHARAGLAFGVSGPLSVRLTGRGELPVSRNAFVYGSRDGQDRGIYRTSPVSGALELGLGFSWQ